MATTKVIIPPQTGQGPRTYSPQTSGQGEQGDKKNKSPKATAPSEPIYWDHLRAGGGVVPEGAERITKEETGQVLFQGTEAIPLICYETAAAAIRQGEVEPLLWMVDDVKQEHHTIKTWVSTKTPEDAEKKKSAPGPIHDSLLRLPDWAAPNGWDFRGRLWAYMDTPNKPRELALQ